MQTAASSREYAKYNALVFVMSFVALSVAVFSIIQMTDDYKDSHALVERPFSGNRAPREQLGYQARKLLHSKFCPGRFTLRKIMSTLWYWGLLP